MSIHNSFFSGKTQIEWTCRAFLSGRTIGHDDEINETRGWRLAAIVCRLKKDYGWPIDTVYSGPEGYARYKLRPGYNRAQLSFPPSARHLSEGGDE